MGCAGHAAHTSDHGPPRWVRDARALQHAFSQLLDLLDERSLVHEKGYVVFHHDLPVYDDRVHAPAVGIVDQVVDGVE